MTERITTLLHEEADDLADPCLRRRRGHRSTGAGCVGAEAHFRSSVLALW